MKGQTRFKRQPDKMHNSLMKANQVVSDGRIVFLVETHQDNTAFILGQVTHAKKFPEHSPVNPCQLDAGGFFHIG